MDKKAKYKGKCYDKYSRAVHLFYEYRGHEYMVTDEYNGYSESLHEQHQEEQKRINKLISDEKKSTKSTNRTLKPGVEEALKELYKIWEQ